MQPDKIAICMISYGCLTFLLCAVFAVVFPFKPSTGFYNTLVYTGATGAVICLAGIVVIFSDFLKVILS